jgi:hypothetical protein
MNSPHPLHLPLLLSPSTSSSTSPKPLPLPCPDPDPDPHSRPHSPPGFATRFTRTSPDDPNMPMERGRKKDIMSQINSMKQQRLKAEIDIMLETTALKVNFANLVSYI